MRLLNVHDLTFKVFAEADIPEYVITSHRWTAGAEAMIKDIVKRRNKETSGYKKIEGFARYIRENVKGIDWFWIDTCCINQDSSSEVATAVNSMFRYYSKAKICLAYLADVPDTTDTAGFRKSVWFRRGWTLQELVAPDLVIFLTEQWEVIGHKGRAEDSTNIITGPILEGIISNITGIRETVLHKDETVPDCSFEEKLQWTEGRETTLEEDMTYCLFGIFGVTLPLIYGEGNTRARKRLLAELGRAAEQPSTQPSGVIPYQRDPDFVENSAVFNQLRGKLSVPSARVALVGLGGVGKTQLAIELAYRSREETPDIWVLWIHCSNADRFEQSVRDIANRANIPGRDAPNANILQVLQTWLSDSKNGKWLVILDNVDDASFLVEVQKTNPSPPVGRRRIDCLPMCEHGSVAITSRNRDDALKLVHDSSIIDVTPMDGERSVALLRKKLGSHALEEDFRRLAEELEFMPLALAQAAAYIKQLAPRITVQQYVQILQTSDEERTKLLERGAANPSRDYEAKDSILLTWQVSFEHIREKRKSAADLLSLMSFCNRQSIPECLVRINSNVKYVQRGTDEGYDTEPANMEEPEEPANIEEPEKPANIEEPEEPDTFEDDIIVLRSFSFISSTTDPSAWEMHRLVQDATTHWLLDCDRYENFKETYIRHLERLSPEGYYQNRKLWNLLWPHVKRSVKLKPVGRDHLLDWVAIMSKAASFARRRGSYEEAQNLAYESMTVGHRLLGKEHRSTIYSANELAWVLGLKGDWKEAGRMLQDLMETARKVLGEQNELTLCVMSNLARSFFNVGQLQAAEELGTKIIENSRNVQGEEHAWTWTRDSMILLSDIYDLQGRLEKAESLVEEVFAKESRVSVEGHPVLGTIRQLAYLRHRRGRYEEAEELQVEALVKYQKIFGDDHPRTIMCRHMLANTIHRQGRYLEAEKLQLTVVEQCHKFYGEDHPNTFGSQNLLASILSSQGRPSEAEELQLPAVERSRRVLGETHPFTLVHMSILGDIYQKLERYEAAEELYAETLEFWSRAFGEKHPNALDALRNLGTLRVDQGNLADAEKYIAKAAVGYREVLGRDHPYTIQVMRELEDIRSELCEPQLQVAKKWAVLRLMRPKNWKRKNSQLKRPYIRTV